ncbi:hypothetical protein [uncultured Nocardioides sp.]|uniref:hypothetical protein n=1 Tax=uncultured Nocardioides sp. TaxID=198441 RepID=UPI002632BAA2|nr:hypothetical protein [uncultured Nocardioides sp.]
MDAFRLVMTVVVMVGVVVAILLFERRRAERIRRDTARMAQGHPDPEVEDDGRTP